MVRITQPITAVSSSSRVHRYPWSCAVLLPAVLLLVGCTGGSGPADSTDVDLTVPDDDAIELAADTLNLMPSETTQALTALSPDDGPDDSLFGFELEEGTEVFYLGDVDDAGNVTVTGMVLQDAAGNLILQQDLGEDSVRFTFPTGDAVTVEQTDQGLHIVVTANATIPPTVVVADIDSEGNVTIDEAASFFGDDENPSYDPDSASFRVRRPGEEVRFLAQTIDPIEDFVAIDACDEIVDGGLFVAEVACDVKAVFNSALELPEAVLNVLCVAQLRLLDRVKRGETGTRVVSALKFGITLGCEGIRYALRASVVVGKLTPMDLACLGIVLLDEGTQAAGGQSTGDSVCALIASLTNDEDDDTVLNHKDNCPMDFNSGQTDTDGDGVGDACDSCIGTPAGVSVDGAGCPDQVNTDGDNDGVIDESDRCPNTLRGLEVDANGCSNCQNDDDNDGVLNCDDNCPHFMTTNTADRDNDGVGDDCDNCPDIKNEDQKDTNFDDRGDACEGIALVTFYQNTDGSSGVSADDAQIKVLGDKQFPLFSWPTNLQVQSIFVSETIGGGAVLWSVAAFIVDEETGDVMDTAFSSSALVYGEFSDPHAEAPDDLPLPVPALVPGTSYVVAITTLSGEPAALFFTIN